MTRPAGEGPRTRKRLSAEELALWDGITKSVRPLRRVDAGEVQPAAAPEAPDPSPATAKQTDGPAPVAPRRSAPKPAPPALAPLERRVKQRVARGAVPLDGRIDLHGFTQDRAHNALLRFLRSAQSDGAKLVLVITGKGARASEDAWDNQRGVLKRLVPQWLGLPEFRPYVIGFEPAHVAHGGEGALYVRVRRARTAE